MAWGANVPCPVLEPPTVQWYKFYPQRYPCKTLFDYFNRDTTRDMQYSCGRRLLSYVTFTYNVRTRSCHEYKVSSNIDNN